MLTFLGDIAFTGLLSLQPEKNAERFAEIIPVLQASDLVFANLEVPVKAGNETIPGKKLVHFSLPEPTEELLKMLKISCVSLANNHIYDFQMAGLKATISMLDRLGIAHTGAGWIEEHVKPAIIEKRGLKIAFIAYVDDCTNPMTEEFPELYINRLDESRIREEIIQIRHKVDKVICSLHWGMDYSYYPTTEQVRTARNLIDCGADIILGHHPHTLQPFEYYSNGLIFYSLGGLTFGDFIKPGSKEIQALMRKTKKGVIVRWFPEENRLENLTTLEKKGNEVVLTNRNYEQWSRKKWKLYRIRNSSAVLGLAFQFKEKVTDRITEFLIGYYAKPLKKIFRLSTYTKISKLFHQR